MAKRTPAGDPGGADPLLKLNYILLGEIAATVGDAPIGTLIDKQILTLSVLTTPPTRPTMHPTSHTRTTASPAKPSMSVPSNCGRSRVWPAQPAQCRPTPAISSDMSARCFDRHGLLSPDTILAMKQATPLSGRHGMATMGFCPCTGHRRRSDIWRLGTHRQHPRLLLRNRLFRSERHRKSRCSSTATPPTQPHRRRRPRQRHHHNSSPQSRTDNPKHIRQARSRRWVAVNAGDDLASPAVAIAILTESVIVPHATCDSF